jgi:PHD/YefM family antitoxin component YafN of YafNO toxin-antitoxin module
MSSSIPASEFTRNFGRYRMLAQREPVPVSNHGEITGYFVSAADYEAYRHYRTQRRAFRAEDLSDEDIIAIANTHMDPRHDHLNALLDDE